MEPRTGFLDRVGHFDDFDDLGDFGDVTDVANFDELVTKKLTAK